jgi:3-deoxy-manno-octulosonate cytidylyltransferase (CMP-KDO synthetase)
MNIQGDEPCIEPDVISKVIHALTGDAAMSTACTPVTNPEQLANPSCVKCVLDQNGAALYFSRSLIPHNAKEALHHLGIYCYKREFLKTYASKDATPLQLSEDLEQLKALENGYTIKVVVLDHPIIDVNDPEDIEKVERYLLENSICQ